MALPPQPDSADLRRRGRQRLIGAIVIVLLAVVFIPMALDPAPRTESPAPALAIPARDAVAPLPPPTAPVKSLAPSMAAKPAVEAAAPASAPAASAPAAAAPATAALVAKPDVAPVAAVPAARLEGFAVQVGAFRDDVKLTQAREKLTAAKITHFIERLPAGDLTRLRAGPYPTRPAAEKALAGVKAAGLEGQVVPLP